MREQLLLLSQAQTDWTRHYLSLIANGLNTLDYVGFARSGFFIKLLLDIAVFSTKYRTIERLLDYFNSV